MQLPLQELKSTVGTKLIVALTGALLALFTLGHMAGNLQVFLGPDAMNEYAVLLRKFPEVLWAVRLGLLGAFVVHIGAVLRLSALNKRARPIAYAMKKPVASTYASRSMLMTGALLALFVIFHLAHFTWGKVQPELYHFTDDQGRHDVYRMVVEGFQAPAYALIYVAAMGLLATHLGHGIASLFQTTGFNNPKTASMTRAAGIGLAMLIAAGFAAVPLLCMMRVVN